MNKAEMKIVHFGENDVIATSGLLLSGLENGISGDAKLGDSLLSNYASDKFYAGSVTTYSRGSNKGKYYYNGNHSATGQELWEADEGSDNASIYGGIYEYHNANEGSGTVDDPLYNYAGWYRISQ